MRYSYKTIPCSHSVDGVMVEHTINNGRQILRLYSVQSKSASILYDNYFLRRNEASAWARDGRYHSRRVESVEAWREEWAGIKDLTHITIML